MKLEELIGYKAIENEEVEFKRRLEQNEPLSWLKCVAGFANTHGGTLYLGVSDAEGELFGYSAEEADAEKLYFHRSTKEHFQSPPDMAILAIPYRAKEKTRYVLKIEIRESTYKPVILNYKGMPMIYMKRDGYVSPATSEEIITLAHQNAFPHFDKQKTDISFLLSDYQKLAAFYEKQTGSKLKEKDLASIGFFDKERHIVSGASLFRDSYDGGHTRIVCSYYRGVTRGDNEVIASNAFTGDLISSYEFAREFIEGRMNHGFVKRDSSRVDRPAYPPRSLFEAIINALAHRDYLIEGTEISVDLFANRLSISSPGSLFGAGELKRTYDLTSFISRRRNELICSVFILCKAMEARGTGFEKIADDYKGNDAAHLPFIFSKNNQFTIVLPDLTSMDGVNVEEESLILLKPLPHQGKYDFKILSMCFGKRLSASQIAESLSLSDSTFFRKEILGALVTSGFLETEKSERGLLYKTNRLAVSLR